MKEIAMKLIDEMYKNKSLVTCRIEVSTSDKYYIPLVLQFSLGEKVSAIWFHEDWTPIRLMNEYNYALRIIRGEINPFEEDR